MTRKFLKWIAPKSFNDGMAGCDRLCMEMARPVVGGSFLDAGCGDGLMTARFAGALGADSLFGIEFVDELRQRARERGIDCIKGDLNERWGFEDDSFDCVLSRHSIEHLYNTPLFLQECSRCLKPGGQVLILTENLSSWINIFALLFGWQPFSTTEIYGRSLGNPFIWHADEPKDEEFLARWHTGGVSSVGHIRVLAFAGLRDLLLDTGFEGVELRTRGYLPIWGRVSELLCEVDRRHGHFIFATGFKPASA